MGGPAAAVPQSGAAGGEPPVDCGSGRPSTWQARLLSS